MSRIIFIFLSFFFIFILIFDFNFNYILFFLSGGHGGSAHTAGPVTRREAV